MHFLREDPVGVTLAGLARCIANTKYHGFGSLERLLQPYVVHVDICEAL